VVSISAQGVDLNVTLPSDIHHLSKLRFLDLRRNRITGPLPQALFPELKTLLVDRNSFTGVPPNILALMPMLTKLTLNDNVELKEWELPAARSPHSQLQVFEARNASVAGTLSLFLRSGSAHPNLVRLLLANNRLAGQVMFSSTMLRYLDLSHNMLTGTIEFITGLPNVQELRLHDNAFTGVLPDFSKLWRLRVLTLSQNQFTGIVPVSLINHGGLTSVSLTENLFQGPLPEFPRSVQTDVAHAAYWGSFCRPEPGPCQERVVLLLLIAAAFQFPVSLATSWKGNDPCAGWLGVYCDNSTGEIIGINLSHLALNGTISPVFGALRSLQALLLGGNNLAGVVLQSLLRLQSLRVLDVSDNAAPEDMPHFRSSVLILARASREPKAHGYRPKVAGKPLVISI